MNSNLNQNYNNENRRDQKAAIVALVVTVFFHAGIVMLLLFTFLRWPPADIDRAELTDKNEILFGGEFVRLGNVASAPDDAIPNADEPMPALTETDVEAVEAVDLENAGTEGAPSSTVTSVNESPMKVKEQPQPQQVGPTKAEIEAAEKAKREKEAAERIRSQMKFGASGTSNASAGQPDGGHSGGNAAGVAGHDLAGRTVASWGANSSTKSGEIKISVRVNSAGKVISASYAGGSGPVSADAAMRKKCIEASLASRFSVREGSDADQTGTITWIFK